MTSLITGVLTNSSCLIATILCFSMARSKVRLGVRGLVTLRLLRDVADGLMLPHQG